MRAGEAPVHLVELALDDPPGLRIEAEEVRELEMRAPPASTVVASLRKPRRRKEFETTKTLEKAIAPPASSGFRRPAAASGSAATL